MPIRRILPTSAAPTPAGLTARPAKSLASHQHPPEQTPAAAEPVTSYQVGYRKPPLHTRFRPGRSGNPRGRPRSAKGLKTIVRESLTQKVAVRTATGEKKISRIEAVLHKLVEQAMKGNPRALAELLKLYAAAVPDAPLSSGEAAAEELTETDLAILEVLKTQLLSSEGEGQ